MGWGGGWGNHAPETARTVAKAFYEGRACKRGNCSTDGKTYWLEHTPIAKRIKPEDIPTFVALKIQGNGPDRRPLEFSYNGWPTKMTARHLSALGVDAEVYGIKNPDCRLGGKPCNSRDWYTKEEIASLPKVVAKPVLPRAPRMCAKPDQFVNLTLSLFA